ncbi:unnamed protein product [Diabrotica balteata]|uniref:Uncharacterized protein n=1 Tax=Diabrotica balteata TaxID=107213 RepID=A0A9N9SSN9_DIABA|nr:unnamed protein product [Diabrotica balteata]
MGHSIRQSVDMYKCFKCGTNHGKMNCPAYGKNCQNCGKLNHYAVGCFNKKHGQVGSDQASQSNSRYHNVKNFGYKNNNLLRKHVHEVDNESSDEDVSYSIDYLILDLVDSNNNKAWYVQAQINNQVKLNLVQKIDSRSQGDDKESFVKNNIEIFEGTGKVPFQYKIMLKNDYKPYISSCRRVPDTVKPLLKNTLEDLERKDIICRLDEPTEWVNNIVIVEKHWIPGEIVGKCDAPRSYMVRDNFGRVTRRNTSFLRPSPN